jgi:hypothetical protein
MAEHLEAKNEANFGRLKKIAPNSFGRNFSEIMLPAPQNIAQRAKFSPNLPTLLATCTLFGRPQCFFFYFAVKYFAYLSSAVNESSILRSHFCNGQDIRY